MRVLYTLIVLSIAVPLTLAQGLRSSADIIKEGIELYEDGSYEDALEKYELIHENDTNYPVALAEIALTHMALEDYEKAIEICDKAIALPYEIRPAFYVNKGTALDELERSDEALSVYDDGIEAFPRYASLYYNKGATLEGMERYQDALDVYYQTLEINPLHANTHGRIGLLALGEGSYTLGMLAINTFLMLEPHTSRSLVYLGACDEYLSGSREPEPKDLPSELKGLFNSIDVIIKNKVALNSKYKVKKPKNINFPFVKQNHAMLSKLTYQSRESNRWYQFYVPFWKQVWEEDKFEGFIYTALITVPADDLQRTLNKNAKDIEEFVAWSKVNWIAKHEKLEAEILGEVRTLPAFYYNDNSLQALGKRNTQGAFIGPWAFYDTDGYKLYEGEFNSRGEQVGTWTWYYPNGQIDRELTFKNNKLDGPFVYYYRNGNISREGTYKNDERHGAMKEYTYTGALESVSNYDNGKMEGEQITYYINAQTDTKYQMVDGEPDGAGETFYDSGEHQMDLNFKDGKREGPNNVTYRDGSVSSINIYKDGQLQGAYKEYYRNGQLYEEGTADEGTLVGKQTRYYRFGKKSDETEFDESGKLNGIIKKYDWDGVLHYEWDYRKGEIVGYRYFDKQGNIIHEDKRSFNRFEFKGYTPAGLLDFKGDYKASEKDGVWKYYDDYGNLIKEEKYDDGVLIGRPNEFYKNGVLRSEGEYEDGMAHGIYKEYFSNKQLATVGHFENDYRTGAWKNYRPDGTLQSEIYYREGSQDGWQKYYDVEGRINYMNYFDQFVYSGTVYFDTLGQERERVMLENGTGTFVSHHPNGKESIRINYLHGKAHGDAIWKDGVGKTELRGKYFNGKRVGKWEWFWDGKPSSTGYYYHGDKDSTWTDYYPDGTVAETNFYEYGIEVGEQLNYFRDGTVSSTEPHVNDQIHGARKFYNPNGKLAMVRYYDKDKIIGYSYSGSDGALVDMIPIKKGTAMVTTYYQNGQKAYEYGLDNGYFHGPYKKYYSDGQLWEEITYVDNDRSGTSYEYYPDGTKKEEQNSFYDTRHGTMTTYHPNGKVKEIRNYKMGELHGKRMRYDENGKTLLAQQWYDGELISQSTPK